MPTSHLDMLIPIHSLCGFSWLIQGEKPKPICRRGAVCKSLLTKELLASVLTPLRRLEAVRRNLASSLLPTLPAPAKNKNGRKENEERVEIIDWKWSVCGGRQQLYLLDTFSTSHTLVPLHVFCLVVSAWHSSCCKDQRDGAVSVSRLPRTGPGLMVLSSRWFTSLTIRISPALLLNDQVDWGAWRDHRPPEQGQGKSCSWVQWRRGSGTSLGWRTRLLNWLILVVTQDVIPLRRSMTSRNTRRQVKPATVAWQDHRCRGRHSSNACSDRAAVINVCLQQLPTFSLAAGYVNPILLLRNGKKSHSCFFMIPNVQCWRTGGFLPLFFAK